MVALVAHDGTTVIRAVYSASVYLSFTLHNGLATELALTDLSRLILGGAPAAQLRRALDRIRDPARTEGGRRLVGDLPQPRGAGRPRQRRSPRR